MTANYGWLSDQMKLDEVLQWLGGRWDLGQLEAWSQGRFKLDELKNWVDGKYSLDEVVTWIYHESDPTAKLVQITLNEIRPGIESHQGSIAFLGIDPQGQVHIAFDGACGSCTVRETTTLENLKDFLVEHVPGVTGVINDGPQRAELGNFGVEDFSTVRSSVVEILPIGRSLPPSPFTN